MELTMRYSALTIASLLVLIGGVAPADGFDERSLSEEEVVLAEGMSAARASILVANAKCDRQQFRNLKRLNAQTAASIAAFKGVYLGFPALPRIDAATAKELVGFQGARLHLGGLTKLDADAALALVMSKAWDGELPGLRRLRADTAKALARFRGESLRLNGVEHLDADAAEALADFEGAELHLDGLRRLEPAAAKALAAFQGRVTLGRLVRLDVEAARALAGFSGSFDVPKGVRARFLAANPLTAETAAAWAALSDGNLPQITAFEAPDSVAVARVLAARQGPLALPNLARISPKTLAALIENEEIEIPLIETLDIILEPDGSGNDDFVIPAPVEERQKRQQRRQQQTRQR